MNAHGWLWHVFNDPMRDNPWSMLALLLILAAAGTALWQFEAWRDRRRWRKGRIAP
jgi:hypothetical protein